MFRHHTISLAALSLALAGCATQTPHTETALASEPAASSQAELDAIFAAYAALDTQNDPITAAAYGDTQALARMPSVSPETRAAQKSALEDIRAQLDALPTDAPDATNRKLLSDLIDQQLTSIAFDEDRLPFTNDWGPHSLLFYAIADTPVRNSDEAALLVQRLEAAPAYIRENTANMRRGIETGFVGSRSTTQIIIADMEKADYSRLTAPFADADPQIKARAETAAAETRTALEEAITFLKSDYLPATHELSAARDQPDGEAWYRFRVATETGSDLTPDEIHAIGLEEVARIRARMEAIIEEVEFEGSFADFLAFLRTDPQFYAGTPEELLEKASEMAKRADGFLPQMFETLPRLPYTVKPVPDEIAPTYTTGRYYTGSQHQGRAGIYYVNTYDLGARPLYELPALTLHEAVPGHHLQIALAQELDNQPDFRRNLMTTAFVEGWGLYAESLGEDADFYRTPYERFGRLSYEMWRACRLVADTGLHWKGWSVEQARTCFTDNSALSEHNIETELQRYVSWPAQALAYKIGEIEFHRLRTKAETALGEDFNIRTFHDVLLQQGGIPFNVVEANLDAWISEQTADEIPANED
ncbi:MAG: DUF885 domain-containing protein [Hirschia sp.]|nr:DUF885 domain-containing protein [Hirschia sp.]MBF19512.1 DUF885 domain-containing protein [Hirschia sp.]